MQNDVKVRKTCFVVMGFGEKTDFQSNPQRVLDLNRTYEDIILPAVTDCDVECIRADKIIHSTVIDKPMYDYLLDADLVVADLSTSNANAIYELGVRHALRPHTTIVMAEKGFAFPFDLNHLSMLKYEHLGKEIGFREVMRVRDELKKKIVALLKTPETDSPVFLFLPKLLNEPSPPPPASTEAPQDDKSFADLMDSLHQAKADVKEPEDWLVAVAVLNRLLKLQPNDAYIIQQLALATYKSKQPDALRALEKGKSILEALLPETSSDVETVGLWGAIHKRLWEVGKKPDDLAQAIRAYARGYFIRNDYYNGINFAFLLNVRAANSHGDDAIADRVLAKRIRREVLMLCDAALAGGNIKGEDLFWVGATKVEALLGLGLTDDSERLRQLILTDPPPTPDSKRAHEYRNIYVLPKSWMVDTMDDQLKKLAALKP
jgi:hypothetical protein